MADAKAAFLDAASTALHLLERGELAERWQQDSVLPQFPVAALAGHLLRGMTTARAGGAEYISVCLPAFAPGTVHRDDG